MLLIGNGRLITRDSELPYLDDGAVVIEGNLIRDAGSTAEMKSKYPDAQFMDARRRLIMPGLINTHQHYYSTMARGMANDSPPATKFSEILKGLWWRLDKRLTLEDTYYSAAVPMIEQIKNGVTTVFDHHASPYAVRGSLTEIARASDDMGIRSSLCYEVSDRDGEKIAQEGIDENMEIIRMAKERGDDMLKGMFGLHASMTVSDATMEKCVAAMEGSGAGFHVHTAEGIEDVEDSLAKYGKRVVKRWNDYGILHPKSIAVHCVHVDEDEMDILAETGVAVVNNPESNMGNAVGCSPVIRMMEKGVMMGLGTDGYAFDMFESYKVGNIIHKHVLKDSKVAWGEVPTMLFENNAIIAERHFDGKLGKLKEGYYADVILVDYNPPTQINSDNINGHLLFGVMGRMVDTTIVNGKILMKDRVLQNIDEERIFARSRELASALWERF